MATTSSMSLHISNTHGLRDCKMEASFPSVLRSWTAGRCSRFPNRPVDCLGFKQRDLNPKTEHCRASLRTKSEFLKFDSCEGLSALSIFKCSANYHLLELKSRALSQKAVVSVIRCEAPQNSDFPRQYSKRERKPFPIPVLELRRNARERIKKQKRGELKRSVPPPKIGLLVKGFIPVAYEVYNARVTLINNLKKLLKVVPVHACGWCNEIHVGPVGHPFRSCKGKNASSRKGLHEWAKATVDDIFLPVEAYHLFDRLGNRITHQERFSIPRIPALVELCIQAGVDIPEYPTKRRRKPIIRIGKSEFIDADESDLPDPVPEAPPKPLLNEIPDSEIVAPASEEERIMLAEETLRVWEDMRKGARRLMKMYPVRVCGYCPEIHVVKKLERVVIAIELYCLN